jgi:hypothetical protein
VDVEATTVSGTIVAGRTVAGAVVSCGEDAVPDAFEPQPVNRVMLMINPKITWEIFTVNTPKA